MKGQPPSQRGEPAKGLRGAAPPGRDPPPTTTPARVRDQRSEVRDSAASPPQSLIHRLILLPATSDLLDWDWDWNSSSSRRQRNRSGRNVLSRELSLLPPCRYGVRSTGTGDAHIDDRRGTSRSLTWSVHSFEVPSSRSVGGVEPRRRSTTAPIPVPVPERRDLLLACASLPRSRSRSLVESCFPTGDAVDQGDQELGDTAVVIASLAAARLLVRTPPPHVCHLGTVARRAWMQLCCPTRDQDSVVSVSDVRCH